LIEILKNIFPGKIKKVPGYLWAFAEELNQIFAGPDPANDCNHVHNTSKHPGR
jgi:hypothetical protein